MRSLIIIILLFIFLPSNAQIVISQEMIGAPLFSIENLSKFKVVNSFSSNLEVSVQSTLLAENGDLICEVYSSNWMLRPGMNRFDQTNVIDEAAWGESALAILAQNQSKLYSGSYEWCVKLRSVNIEEDVESCLLVTSAFDNFLELVYPPNKSTISDVRPNFSWISSLNPIQLGAYERYEYILTSNDKDQSPREAINDNSPLLYIPNVKSFGFPYPANTSSLIPGKEYSWQIVHMINDTPLLYSDVWTFKVEKMDDPRDLRYVELTSVTAGTIIPVYSDLFIRMSNSSDDETPVFRWRDEKGIIHVLDVEREHQKKLEGTNELFVSYKVRVSLSAMKEGIHPIQVVINGKTTELLIQYMP